MATVTPYVMVEKAHDFIAFLDATFHAEIGELVPLDSDPNRVIHGVATIGDSRLFFADSGADGCRCLETPEGPVHVQLHVELDDPEGAYERGVAAGPRSAMPVTDQGDGTRFGGFVDPFGTLWWPTGTK